MKLKSFITKHCCRFFVWKNIECLCFRKKRVKKIVRNPDSGLRQRSLRIRWENRYISLPFKFYWLNCQKNNQKEKKNTNTCDFGTVVITSLTKGQIGNESRIRNVIDLTTTTKNIIIYSLRLPSALDNVILFICDVPRVLILVFFFFAWKSQLFFSIVHSIIYLLFILFLSPTDKKQRQRTDKTKSSSKRLIEKKRRQKKRNKTSKSISVVALDFHFNFCFGLVIIVIRTVLLVAQQVNIRAFEENRSSLFRSFVSKIFK